MCASLIVLVFSGCDPVDDPTPPGPDLNDTNFLLPLAIGNIWIYDSRTYVDDILDSSSTDTSLIDTSFTYEAEIWYGRRGGDDFYHNGNGGTWLMFYDNGEFGEPFLAYPYPTTAGHEWYEYGESDTATFTVESVSAVVPTPAGNFSGCYYIHAQNTTAEFVSDEWFKPGIGMVRGRYYMNNDSYEMRMEEDLRSYTIH
jgi:hypothetical protein